MRCRNSLKCLEASTHPPPNHRSTSELADALVAGKGSISTTTRHLIQVGLIEGVGLPGVRRDYFRLRPDAWFQMVKQELARMTFLGELVDRGYALLEDQSPEMRDRLQELPELKEGVRVPQARMAGLVHQWEEQRPQRVEGVDEYRHTGAAPHKVVSGSAAILPHVQPSPLRDCGR